VAATVAMGPVPTITTATCLCTRHDRSRRKRETHFHLENNGSSYIAIVLYATSNGKGSQYPNTERRLPELIPVISSQPAGNVSHKPGGRLPLLSARPAVSLATLKRVATNYAA